MKKTREDSIVVALSSGSNFFDKINNNVNYEILQIEDTKSKYFDLFVEYVKKDDE